MDSKWKIISTRLVFSSDQDDIYKMAEVAEDMALKYGMIVEFEYNNYVIKIAPNMKYGDIRNELDKALRN